MCLHERKYIFITQGGGSLCHLKKKNRLRNANLETVMIKRHFYDISLANIATYKENTRTCLIKDANGTNEEVEAKTKKKKPLDG